MKLYRNGVLDSTDTNPDNHTIGPPNNKLTFGTRFPGSSAYTSGAIDELIIFHIILSDIDVNNLYNAYWNT